MSLAGTERQQITCTVCCFQPPGLYLLHWTGGESLVCEKNRAGRGASPALWSIRKMDARGSSGVLLLAVVGSRAPIRVALLNLFRDPLAFTESTDANNHMGARKRMRTEITRPHRNTSQVLASRRGAGQAVWIVFSALSASSYLTRAAAVKTHSTPRTDAKHFHYC